MKSNILPPGIRLHRSGKFIIDKTVQGKRITKTFDSLQDAIIYRMKLDDPDFRKTVTGIDTPKAIVTLKAVLEYCETHVWRDLRSMKTHVTNARDLLSYFGDVPMSQIDQQAIDGLKEHLASKGNRTGTINRKLMVLSNLFTVAKSRGMMTSEAPKIKVKQQREGRIRVVSREEEKLLEQHLSAECWNVVQVLLYTGCRPAELWRVEARDVDQTLNTMTFWETKTGKSRTIPIMINIRDIISKAVESHPVGCIFPTWNNTKLERAWAKVKAEIGLQDDEQFIPYCLRHTCASRLAAQNISLNLIKDWLGHSTINTTMRYTHFRKSDLAQVAEMFAQALK